MPSDLRPQVVARFKTTADGQPEFITGNAKRYYKIVFEVENAPPDAYAATFELDPSYYDPRRTLSPDRDGRFRLELTTYRDYDVSVSLRTKEGEVRIGENLAQALRRSRERHPEGANGNQAAIDDALAYIAAH